MCIRDSSKVFRFILFPPVLGRFYGILFPICGTVHLPLLFSSNVAKLSSKCHIVYFISAELQGKSYSYMYFLSIAHFYKNNKYLSSYNLKKNMVNPKRLQKIESEVLCPAVVVKKGC